MKRKITAALLAALLLCGCGAGEDPYRVDTVVRIPVNPTDAPTQPPETEATAGATEAPTVEFTEAPTEEATEPTAAAEPTEAPKQSSGGSKSSGKKSTSGKSSSSDKNNREETEPPGTESSEPETEPPAEIPGTDPAATGPAATEPEAAENPETQAPTEAPQYDISGYCQGSLEYAMEAEINAARAAEGLSEIGLDSRLSAVASCRASEIARLWSHTRPDGRDYATVLEDYGYGASRAAELLVHLNGEGDAAAIVSMWLGSDSHRDNLMGGWSAIGIGVYRENGYTYVCCLLTA